MAKKTIVEKAGETIGVGIAMASDVAGAIKTAVTAATKVIKDEPAANGVKRAAKKITKRVSKNTSAKKVAGQTQIKSPSEKKSPKASAKKSPKKASRMKR